MSVNLQDKIALVTGASRGIGYFTALELAKAGAHVIACARTVGGLEELDDAIKAVGGRSTLVPFDLADMDAIDRLGGSIFERWGKLDILVANAGVLGTISPIGHVEAKVFEKVMTINVTATWRLIRSVEPLLMRSEAGRAVILSSSAAHKCRAFWGPTQPPRRPSKPWPAPGPEKHTAHRCASPASTRAPPALPCGHWRCPEKTRDRAASPRCSRGHHGAGWTRCNGDWQAVRGAGEQAGGLPVAGIGGRERGCMLTLHCRE